MSARSLFLISLVAIGVTTQSVWADIMVSGAPAPSRSVLAVGGIPPVAGSDSTAATGVYTVDRIGGGPSMGGVISAHASQSSSIPLPSPLFMGGGGLVEASTSSPPMTSFSGTVDSFFDVFFTVSASGPFQYHAKVKWESGSVPLHAGSSTVKLSNVTDTIVYSLIKKDTGDQGSADLGPVGIFVDLEVGKSYRLEARSHIDVGGVSAGITSSMGTWSFDLTSIPEPNAWALWVPITVGLALVGWYRRIVAAGQPPPRHEA